MLTGKRFRLRTGTLGIQEDKGTRWVVRIPSGDEVKVVSGPKPGDRMVDVLWDGHVVVIFAVDLAQCGEEVEDREAG